MMQKHLWLVMLLLGVQPLAAREKLEARAPAKDETSRMVTSPISSGSDQCLGNLRGTKTLTGKGEIRFLLLDPNMDEGLRPGVVLTVDPADLAYPLAMCSPLRSQSGALRVNSIALRIGEGRAMTVGISDMAYRGLEVASKDYIEMLKSWIPRGGKFGLRLYQEVFGVKNGTIQPDATYGGARFVGQSKSGHYVEISCVDFDYARDIACRFREQLSDNVMLSTSLSALSLEDWNKYSDAGERYFLQHAEQ